MNPDRPEIDPASVRRQFEDLGRRNRGVANGEVASGEGDFIVREVSRRMAERLGYIKLDPKRALDAGCGSGSDLPALKQRFPAAQLHAVDFAHSRLAAGRAAYLAASKAALGPFERLGMEIENRFKRTLGRPIDTGSKYVDWTCADFAALPYAARTIDFIWSNLALHWHGVPHRVFPEWARVLDVGGLVLFSAFGPDTLKEIARASSAIGRTSVLPFTDMHDYGDMLVEAGFVTPVVDAERITLTYSSRATLWRDVRALGGNALAGRSRGLLGRGRGKLLDAALDAQRSADGRYPLSFEVIYGHAWNGQPKTASDGRAIIHFDLPRKGSPT